MRLFHLPRTSASALLTVLLVGCGREPEPPEARETPRPPQTRPAAPAGEAPPPAAADQPVLETKTGPAVYISDAFHGKKTASGDTYDRGQLVAAHPSYPMGTLVRVTNLENGRAVVLRVIDRSGAAKNAESPIIDVSRAAAERLGFLQQGRVRIRAERLEPR
jgi:rare lipoprotein A